MNLIKRHKGLAIIGTLTLILSIIIFIIFARMFFGSNNSTYGDRLSNIPKLNNETTKKLTDEVAEKEEVSDVSVRIQGKIIYIMIKYDEGTKLSKAKEIATNTLEYFDDEIKASYDFGYFLVEEVSAEEDDEEEEKKGFLAAGTKHPDNDSIGWTKE